MNVLVAYDGSAGADAALHDLKRAGLPSQANSMVLTVADVWPPPATEDDLADLAEVIRARILELRENDKRMLVEAGNKAGQAARIVQASFPTWKVRGNAVADSPAWGILKQADEWLADLIVVGSHGMSVTERLLIGSVSQRVMTHASCSVRVARERGDVYGGPLRLIIGFDGSTDAEAAVREVIARPWPQNTEVLVVTAVDQRMLSAIASRVLKLHPSSEAAHGDHHAWLAKMTQQVADRLNKARLIATGSIAHGEPKRVLIESARDWAADCIFLGATGLSGLRRLLIGSVSSAVTAHAGCSVEVVRARRLAEETSQ
jgi:nucleotide-binding universal stress UspA family protein